MNRRRRLNVNRSSGKSCLQTSERAKLRTGAVHFDGIRVWLRSRFARRTARADAHKLAIRKRWGRLSGGTNFVSLSRKKKESICIPI